MSEDMSWKAALYYDPCLSALSGIRDSQLRLGDIRRISGLRGIGLRACSELNPDGKINCEDVPDPIVPFEEAGDTYRKYVVESPSLSFKMGVIY